MHVWCFGFVQGSIPTTVLPPFCHPIILSPLLKWGTTAKGVSFPSPPFPHPSSAFFSLLLRPPPLFLLPLLLPPFPLSDGFAAACLVQSAERRIAFQATPALRAAVSVLHLWWFCALLRWPADTCWRTPRRTPPPHPLKNTFLSTLWAGGSAQGHMYISRMIQHRIIGWRV